MRTVLALACLLLAHSNLSAQQKSRPADALLPAESLIYFRYDGLGPHRQAYAKTLLHQLMQEDLGDFLGYVAGKLKGIAFEQAKAAANPALQKAADFLKGPDDILKYIDGSGVALGLEVISHTPFRWQLTTVFPNAAKVQRDNVLGLLRLTAAVASAEEIHETKHRGRLVFQLGWDASNAAPPDDPLRAPHPKGKPAVKKNNIAAWWVEAEHVVFVLGSEPVEHALDLMDGKRASWAESESSAKVSGFDSYETFARLHVDLARAVALLGTPKPNEDAKQRLKEAFARRLLIRRLGVDGLNSVTMHWGFEGQSQRSTALLSIAEPKLRKGLLRLFASNLEYDPKKLPPLPPDTNFVSVTSVDWQALYDTALQLARIAEFKQRSDAGEAFGKPATDLEPLINDWLTFDLREELKSFGSTCVIYKAASEGPLFLGYCVAVQTRDAKSLHLALSKLLKPLQKLAQENGGTELAARLSIYRGVSVHSLLPKGMGIAPSYAIHNNWFVTSLYPQPLRALLLRSAGQRSSWPAPPHVHAALAHAFKSGNSGTRLASVTVSNPAHMLERLLPLAPLLVQLAGGGGLDFDVTQLPHARAITEPLFPNVTICVDDGMAIRWETHASLAVPSGGILLLMYFGGGNLFAF